MTFEKDQLTINGISWTCSYSLTGEVLTVKADCADDTAYGTDNGFTVELQPGEEGYTEALAAMRQVEEELTSQRAAAEAAELERKEKRRMYAERRAERDRAADPLGKDPKKAEFIGQTWQGNGWTVTFSAISNRTEIAFAGIPSEQVREMVKEAGFWWAPSKGAWVAGLTWKKYRAAEKLNAQLAQLASKGPIVTPYKRSTRRSWKSQNGVA